MSIFTTVPGYTGFFGPATGNNVTVSFGRGDSIKATKDNIHNINNGFFCDQYVIDWNRPAQAKRFLNVTRPVAIVGFGTGTLTMMGLLGTYAGFQALVGENTASTADDVCKPLFCIISPSNNFAACDKEAKDAASAETTQWHCTNLLLARINVTGQVQDNGVLFQQANITFTMGGLAPRKITKGDIDNLGGSDDDVNDETVGENPELQG
jgi:hypothetical protein